MRRAEWFLSLLLIATLACTLSVSDSSDSDTDTGDEVADAPTATVDNSGPPPTVQILSPADGQQVTIGQDVEISVVAQDNSDVTRLLLSVDGRTSSTKSFPEPVKNAEALLRWRPDREGTFDLSVIAFRAFTPSAPVTLRLQVVGRGDALSNPAIGQPQVETGTQQDCAARVLIGNLRRRTGPGTQYDRVDFFSLNEQLTVTGMNFDSSNQQWLKVRQLNGEEYWAMNNPEWITLAGACSSLPQVN